MSPWIRLSDSYIDHPKFLALSASAFRLWHEGIAFCRKHETDGLIPKSALQGFRYFQQGRVSELTTTIAGEGGPLWETVDGFGYKVRNYLDWNLSKEEAEKDRESGKARSKKWREKRFKNATDNTVRDASPHAHEPDRNRNGSLRSSEGVQGKPSALSEEPSRDLAMRAGAFVETFEELFQKYRRGAKYFRRQPALDFDRALGLCRTWDDERLLKLVEVFMNSDEDWIVRSDYGLAAFSAKATWCDERLASWEAQQRRQA